MTQVARVLTMLREAGPQGVCSIGFYRAALPHARNRISIELKARGYVIRSEPCGEDDHGDTTYFRYWLISEPARSDLPTNKGSVVGRSVRTGNGGGDLTSRPTSALSAGSARESVRQGAPDGRPVRTTQLSLLGTR